MNQIQPRRSTTAITLILVSSAIILQGLTGCSEPLEDPNKVKDSANGLDPSNLTINNSQDSTKAEGDNTASTDSPINKDDSLEGESDGTTHSVQHGHSNFTYFNPFWFSGARGWGYPSSRRSWSSPSYIAPKQGTSASSKSNFNTSSARTSSASSSQSHFNSGHSTHTTSSAHVSRGGFGGHSMSAGS